MCSGNGRSDGAFSGTEVDGCNCRGSCDLELTVFAGLQFSTSITADLKSLSHLQLYSLTSFPGLSISLNEKKVWKQSIPPPSHQIWYASYVCMFGLSNSIDPLSISRLLGCPFRWELFETVAAKMLPIFKANFNWLIDVNIVHLGINTSIKSDKPRIFPNYDGENYSSNYSDINSNNNSSNISGNTCNNNIRKTCSCECIMRPDKWRQFCGVFIGRQRRQMLSTSGDTC